MLNYKKTRLTATSSHPIVEGAQINEEGLAMVKVRSEGQTEIQPSTGAAGEIFAGFAYHRVSSPSYLGLAGTSTVDASKPFDLTRVPNEDMIGIFIGSTKLTIEAGTTPSAAGTVALQGSKLHFHSDDDGSEFRYQIQYTPSYEEAITYGDRIDRGTALPTEVAGACGVIVGGEISTTAWDPTVNWADLSVKHPSLGANGLLTIGGSGTKLDFLVIEEAPAMGEDGVLTVSYIR
tara:strand:+ start:746 stop:1447 length:702 start_codon:yes stop_codon:yes gene_type:complete